MKREHGIHCPCVDCQLRRESAVRLVDRKIDLREIPQSLRPFVLAEREKRNPTRTPSTGISGPSYTTKGKYDEGADGGYHENAVRDMEDSQ